ncbi:MAG: FHA domain-containing protein [Myxococcales bacterium]|nr:FHA domain-containing protein [Myxococcales bacterium]
MRFHTAARSLSLRLRLLLGLLVLLTAGSTWAAPQARLLRVDPRAAVESGGPVLTTVIEVSQGKRVSDAVRPCATLRGNAQLDCMSDALEKPLALYTPFNFPAENALFAVHVDGTDRQARYLSHTRWGESQQTPGVGTAWLILIDADARMGSSFTDARELAKRFVESMGPNDTVNIMFFNDRQVVEDSKWLPAAKKKNATAVIDGVTRTFASQGRNRSLLTIIKQAATDAFSALGNAGEDIQVPLHQALVVLSTGFGGADPATTGPGALQLSQYLTGGRFPEDNSALPKTPVPVISVFFPPSVIDEYRQNSLEFMQNLADPEIGGFFTVMRQGQASRAPKIVEAVRSRFARMYIVKWRVACIAPTTTQSFRLVFTNVDPPLLGDNSFKDVPVGIDPTTWPLDVNVEATQQDAARRGGIYPGGTFRVYGDFCWGGDASRAEVYFVPAGQQLPAELAGASVEKAKQTQQQLIAMDMKGRAVVANDSFVEFEAPDKDKILHGSGEQAVVRLVVFDNRAGRTSGATADTVLQLKGTTPPLPILLILGGAFALVVLALLLVVMLRMGGKRRPAAPAAAPAFAGHYPAPAPIGGPAVGGPMMASAGAAMGGGVARGAPVGGASRATLQGPAGVFTVLPGLEMKAGRDGGQCAIFLENGQVSAVHASLKLEGGQLLVRDEGSTGGTTINGHPVSPGAWTPLHGGDRVAFGPVELTVTLE